MASALSESPTANPLQPSIPDNSADTKHHNDDFMEPGPSTSFDISSSSAMDHAFDDAADQSDSRPRETNKTSTYDVAHNRQTLSRKLQLHGYSACREAIVLLEDHFNSSSNYESMEDFITRLNLVITFDPEINSSIISPNLAHEAIKRLKSSHSGNVIGVDEAATPRLPECLPVKIKNVQCDTTTSDTKQTPFSRLQENEFTIHYNFLHKKLSSKPIFQGDYRLTSLSTLTASTDPSIRCICFGLLIKDVSKIDGYMLIDNTGRVPLRISPDTTFRNQMSYTNCIVLVEGVYVNPDDILYAANIGLPPILLDPVQDKSLACVDEKMVVLLRDLYLDESDVCEALDLLFSGYDAMEVPPLVFILIGNFTRAPCDSQTFRAHMKKLLRIIRTCDNLKECHYVFVPGPSDSLSHARIDGANPNKINLPLAPLSKERLPLKLLQLSNIRNIHLATNPAHIYLGDRLISVVSHPYLKELRKNLIYDLSDHREELFDIVKQIILSNGHLTAGVGKNFHSSMNLWHRPDLLLLADTDAIGNRYDYNSPRNDDTSFATVPSFSRSYKQFKVYFLTTGDIDDSQVSQDALNEIEEDDQILTIDRDDESK